uniref:Uncharacterized protein n=1 Tax=Anguilla anguilla TaxID=7936 RepID=A0A0E9SQD9_ANGAN
MEVWHRDGLQTVYTLSCFSLESKCRL